MNADDIRKTVLEQLGNIAPEADLAQLDPAVSFRDQLDIDSMDRLNFYIALCKTFRIDIPERDYGKLTMIDECVTYVEHAIASRASH